MLQQDCLSPEAIEIFESIVLPFYNTWNHLGHITYSIVPRMFGLYTTQRFHIG